MTGPALEWKAVVSSSRRGPKTNHCYQVVIAGPRGAVREIILRTPLHFGSAPLPAHEERATLAAASPEMFAALAAIEEQLLAGKTVTIAPMTRAHIDIGMSLAKARGKRAP